MSEFVKMVKQWSDLLKEETDLCNRYADKETRLSCKFKLLHDITVAQDQANINLMRDLDDDKDPRWLPIHIMDNANALILNISEQGGILHNMEYLEEKFNALSAKMFMLPRRG